MDVEWSELTHDDLSRIAELARKCVTRDGGLQATASPPFLARRFAGEGTVAIGAVDGDGHLLACGAVRPSKEASAIVGLVDPDHRGRGLGSELLDRLIEAAKGRSKRFHLETEALTPEAHELFLTRGFERTFAEDVYRFDLTREPLPRIPLPQGVQVEEWAAENHGAFYDAYRASFADRPGFPGWSQDEWIDWLVDDEFLPQCSLVARTAEGAPAGFVACARGFLIQVGAVPEWRRRGLGRALAATALGRLRGHGDTEVFLDVNVNNPASAALFQGLGFTPIGRRARYERQ